MNNIYNKAVACRKYYEKNKDKHALNVKRYYEQNKDKMNEYQRNRYHERKLKNLNEPKESETLIQVYLGYYSNSITYLHRYYRF